MTARNPAELKPPKQLNGSGENYAKVVEIQEKLGFDALKVVDRPDPAPGSRQIVLKMRAFSAAMVLFRSRERHAQSSVRSYGSVRHFASGKRSRRSPSLSFDDAAALHNAVAIAVSPDGKSVLYRVRFGGTKGSDNTEWQLIAAAGGELRYLDAPEKFQPTGFTRDGAALYGIYEINKMAQLATFPLAPENTPAAVAASPSRLLPCREAFVPL